MPLAVVSAPAGFFQIGQVHNATIEDLTSEINDALSAVTDAGSVVSDAQAHADAAQASATAASSSAATAAAAAGSVTNPLSTVTTSAQTVASPVSLGTTSTNFVTASGGSAQATLKADGSGSSQLLVRGLGSGATGQVNIGSTAGGGVLTVIGATATGNGALSLTQPSATTSPLTFGLVTNTAGVQWSNVPTLYSRTWTWSGLQTGAANRSFTISNTISGTVQDAASSAAPVIFNVLTTFNGYNAGGIGTRGAQFWSVLGTGTMGPTIMGLSGQVSQSGVPGYPNAWAQSTAYSAVGTLVVGSNGAMYRVETVGTSASTGTGPTGSGSAITDGSNGLTWSWQGAASSATQTIGISGLAAASQNCSGVSGAYVGHQWGAIFGSQATAAATYWSESIGVEIDDYWNGGEIGKICALQIARNGIKATNYDWGLSLSAVGGSPAKWRNALIFQAAVDANGYGIAFEDQISGLAQHMAGVFDARMAVPDGTGRFGGGFYFRWKNGSIDQNGAGQFRCASITPTSDGVAVDVTNQELQSLAITSGGTNWAVAMQWKGNDGSYGTVATVSGTAIATVTVTVPSQQPSGSLPTAVTLYPVGGNGAIVGATGVIAIPTVATATPTYAAPTNPRVYLGSATTDIVTGKGSAGATSDTAGHLCIPFVSGTPTGVPDSAAKGIAIRYDISAHKLWAYDNSTSTWKGVALT